MAERRMLATIFIVISFVMAGLPLLTTFNEVLARAAMKFGWYRGIQSVIVPVQVKMVAVMLSPLGLSPKVYGEYLALDGFGPEKSIYLIEIAWNCLGWQSLIFFAITALVGVQGDSYSNYSKFQTIFIGLLGTIVLNILRIALVVLLTFYVNRQMGAVVHEYGSTFLMLGWLWFFWWFAYKYVLEQKTPLE